MSEWKKGISKAGKIREKAFSAVVTAIYPSQIPTGTGILQIDFDDGSNAGVFGIDKAKITADGVEVGGSLASFQESLEALGFECMWGTDGAEILGFKTEPDILGSKIWMEPLESTTVGDESQTKKRVMWGIVTKVEKGKSQPASTGIATNTKPGKLTKAPRTAPDTPKGTNPNPELIAKRILDEGVDTQSVGDLYTYFKREYKPGELRDALAIISG